VRRHGSAEMISTDRNDAQGLYVSLIQRDAFRRHELHRRDMNEKDGRLKNEERKQKDAERMGRETRKRR
jgi:hypothetical protein